MTVKELQKDFEKKFPALAAKGVSIDFAVLIKKAPGQVGRKSVNPDIEIDPRTHWLHARCPLIFDHRKLPATFHGFHLQYLLYAIPEEFEAYDVEPLYLYYDECWSEERIIAYVREHALEICEK
jgi:hypothetical protein